MYNIEYKALLTSRHYNKITHYYEYNMYNHYVTQQNIQTKYCTYPF